MHPSCPTYPDMTGGEGTRTREKWVDASQQAPVGCGVASSRRPRADAGRQAQAGALPAMRASRRRASRRRCRLTVLIPGSCTQHPCAPGHSRTRDKRFMCVPEASQPGTAPHRNAGRTTKGLRLSRQREMRDALLVDAGARRIVSRRRPQGPGRWRQVRRLWSSAAQEPLAGSVSRRRSAARCPRAGLAWLLRT
jgi:hypothetical protein